METKNKTFITIALLLIIIGFALSLGSIMAFIAMNMVAPQPLLPGDFVIWQRFFIIPIMNYVTIPAIILFLLGNGLFLLFVKSNKKGISTTLFFLSVAIFVNGMFFIIPTAYKANTFVISKNYLEQHWDAFLSEKTMEDILGGINMLFLLLYLCLAIYMIIKTNFKQIEQ